MFSALLTGVPLVVLILGVATLQPAHFCPFAVESPNNNIANKYHRADAASCKHNFQVPFGICQQWLIIDGAYRYSTKIFPSGFSFMNY
ncbi:hypothetical protein [Xenorhabdus mauleonii]|uniref:hypothetical protein n=1 Tax=Xenorhabdus mauleonii TaxID=351675 RepID=UPI001473FEFC|nr:hypothetical protein [Xenorhabdus mauleonii]